MKHLPVPTTIAFLITALLGAQPAAAQRDDDLTALRRQVETLAEGQQEIQKNLTAIKKLLEPLQPKKPKPFEPIEMTLEGSAVLGDPDAAVTLVEFTDYQCPFCRRHFTNTMPQILKNYVEAGKVRYAIKEFPLTAIHARAGKASEAALCAGDQGKYWEIHELIFKDQRKLRDADLVAHAESLSLDVDQFQSCLADGKYTGRVKADVSLGAKAGVRGTPSFLLGLTDTKSAARFQATKALRGAQPYRAFEEAIDELIAAAEGKKEAANAGSE